MAKSKVAVIRTSPGTVLSDYHSVLNLAGYQDVIAKDADTALKVNISWHFFFPGCSTTPWQLEGVIRAMKQDGYDPALIHACHNRTVVIDAHLGERENKQVNVVDAHKLRNIHIYETEEWMNIREAVGDLTKKFTCLNEVYPKGFMIPKRFIGENIIHLPTVKTHVFTTTTGAMKNAFGGLLNEHRHWTHPVIHETLVDLLMIQKKIHRGVFAVMDGTFAGDGPGPRCMVPHVKNVLLASADQVAIDAVAAKLMGFDPMKIKFIRMAHEMGLGCGDPRDIERTDDLVLELFPDDDHLRRWITIAREKVHFQGLPARICWLGQGARAKFGMALNDLVASGEISAPIVIGRDHLDCGSVASPNRETEAMKDGSDAVSDWPLLNALLNTASGATWVSLHHGGGVGMGYSQHAGMVIVADGTDDAARRLERVLWNDPATGVMRHADAGYEEAIDCAREHGLDLPMVGQ